MKNIFTKKIASKKLLIVPAVIVVAGLIYAGVQVGSNNNNGNKTDKPVVAAAHTNGNGNANQGTNDNSADNSGNSDPNSLGYNLNAGSTSNNKVASNNTGNNTGGSSSNSGGTSNSGSGTTTTPPVVTPVTTPPVVTPNNLIANPSAEDSTAAAPTGWAQAGFGTNTSTYSYLNTGHTGGHSLQVATTARDADPTIAGDAKWGFTAIPVTAGQSYQFSDYYQSNVATEVDAAFTVNGVATFVNLGAVAPSAGWTQFNAQFTVPVGTTSLVVYHILANVGTLTTDDYSLTSYTPATFNRGIVTINFDDGWLSQYNNAVPALQANGLTATFFIITDSSLTNPDPEYMNASQIITLKNDGFEIGNHTETHPDLTTLTAAQVQTEMGGAESALQSAIGVTATDFAYPFGAYNASTIAIGQSVGFLSQRSVVSGFNSKDSLNLTQLKIEEVDANITTAQVQAWVDQAIAQHTWLILVYHEIDTVAPAGSNDEAYLTSPANLATELSYIKSTGVAIETTAQAVAEVSAQ